MRLDWLGAVCASPGPFATVLLDVSHDTEDAVHRDVLRRRSVRDDLATQGAPDAVLEIVESALADAAPPDGTAGRVLVADQESVLLDALTPAPPASPRSLWAAVPDLLAVAVAVQEPVASVVVRIDEQGGEIMTSGEHETEQVGGDSGPVHKVRGGGLSHLRMQERVEESWRRNTADVAGRVDEKVRTSGARVLVITGDAPSRARLRDALPERSARIAAEVEHSADAGPGDLPDTVARAVQDLLDEERRAALARYTQAAGRPDGLAVTGLASVVAAAQAQAVDSLLVDPATVADEQIWNGPEVTQLAVDENELAQLGVEERGMVAAVPALIRAAACTGASLIVLDDPDAVLGRDVLDDARPTDEAPAGPGILAGGALVDGLGAVLRFPIGPTS